MWYVAQKPDGSCDGVSLHATFVIFRRVLSCAAGTSSVATRRQPTCAVRALPTQRRVHPSSIFGRLRRVSFGSLFTTTTNTANTAILLITLLTILL